MTDSILMREIKFRVWHLKEQKMYFRGYQKWFYVVLCRDDEGKEGGRGIPVKKANYSDCELFESTGVEDKRGREIFEGDLVRVHVGGKFFEDVVGPVPDMFKSRRLHPLHDLFVKHGIDDHTQDLEIEILGNSYENPVLKEI